MTCLRRLHHIYRDRDSITPRNLQRSVPRVSGWSRRLGSISPNPILPNLFLIGEPTTTCFVVFCFFDKLCFVVHHFFCTIFWPTVSKYTTGVVSFRLISSRRILTLTLTLALTLTLVRFQLGLCSQTISAQNLSLNI